MLYRGNLVEINSKTFFSFYEIKRSWRMLMIGPSNKNCFLSLIPASEIPYRIKEIIINNHSVHYFTFKLLYKTVTKINNNIKNDNNIRNYQHILMLLDKKAEPRFFLNK